MRAESARGTDETEPPKEGKDGVGNSGPKAR
jgi:hypothetical protein